MRKVLIVEDDRFITAIFTMFIKELEHDLIGRCASGLEAIELCKKVKPDVVLMDIHLEGELDGIQTSTRLQREIGVPVIYVSSDTSTDVIKRAVVSNSYGFLVKPINKQELKIAIDLAFYKYRVDQEQKKREQGYREFISDSPIPTIIIADGRIKYLNNSALNTLKTHYIEDVMGQAISTFIGEGSYQQLMSGVDKLLTKGDRLEPQTIQFKTVHGEIFWCEIQGSKVIFNEQETVQLLLNNTSRYNNCDKREAAINAALEDGSKYIFRINNSFELGLVNFPLKRDVLSGVKPTNISDLVSDVEGLKSLIKASQKETCENFDIEIILKSINSSVVFTAFPKVCSLNNFEEMLFIQK